MFQKMAKKLRLEESHMEKWLASSGLQHLPEQILSYLDFEDVLSARLVCHNFKTLIDRKHSLWPDNLSSLHVAARFNDVTLAEMAIDSNVDLEKRMQDQFEQPVFLLERATALHVAAYYSSNYVLQLLVRKGANIDQGTNHVQSVMEVTWMAPRAPNLMVW